MHFPLSQKIERIFLGIMQRKDPFCKCISKRLLSCNAPSHEVDTFTCIKGLIYKHVISSNQQFLALVIPKSWCFTVLAEAHDKIRTPGNEQSWACHQMTILLERICKYIDNCALYKKEKARTHVCPLQMTDIPYRHFDKVAIDLVSDLNVSVSGNQHILAIIDHLTEWPEAFPIPDKKADTIIHISSIITCPFTCALTSYCQIMAQNSRTCWWTMFTNIVALTTSFLPHITCRVMENCKFATKMLNLLLRNCVKRIQTTGINTSPMC